MSEEFLVLGKSLCLIYQTSQSSEEFLLLGKQLTKMLKMIYFE